MISGKIVATTNEPRITASSSRLLTSLREKKIDHYIDDENPTLRKLSNRLGMLHDVLSQNKSIPLDRLKGEARDVIDGYATYLIFSAGRWFGSAKTTTTVIQKFADEDWREVQTLAGQLGWNFRLNGQQTAKKRTTKKAVRKEKPE